jgi:hypothetical protein
MEFVNVEAIEALDTEELARAIREDSMPWDQYIVMRRELTKRATEQGKEVNSDRDTTGGSEADSG